MNNKRYFIGSHCDCKHWMEKMCDDGWRMWSFIFQHSLPPVQITLISLQHYVTLIDDRSKRVWILIAVSLQLKL